MLYPKASKVVFLEREEVHIVAQADLELDIFLPPLWEHWDCRCVVRGSYFFKYEKTVFVVLFCFCSAGK